MVGWSFASQDFAKLQYTRAYVAPSTSVVLRLLFKTCFALLDSVSEIIGKTAESHGCCAL